jgi:release factor glutamine methyltransferase
MASVAELLHATGDLPGDSATRDLELLLGHCLSRSRTWLYTWPETELTAEQLARFMALRARRVQGEPVAHLIGSRDFWTLSLATDASTLIPRPETETLVEWTLELPLPRDTRVLDLGTGSGAIALALASERPHWQVTGVDAREAAVDLARRNAQANRLDRVRLLVADWFDGLDGESFDLVVSNPPYVAAGDPHLESGDLRFEPRSALVAAQDGLADLATIASQAPAYLNPGGWLLLEHGHEQGAAVRDLLRTAGFSGVDTRRDLAGHERISGGIRDAG